MSDIDPMFLKNALILSVVLINIGFSWKQLSILNRNGFASKKDMQELAHKVHKLAEEVARLRGRCDQINSSRNNNQC